MGQAARQADAGRSQGKTGMIDPIYSLSGFCVGALVGLTGVGGGSLMTPLLILLFGVHAATAVGTDLLFAACTKTVGVAVHARTHTIDWRITGLLAAGSLPMAALTIATLHQFDLRAAALSEIVTPVLAVAILLAALLVLFQRQVIQLANAYGSRIGPGKQTALTVAAGCVLGVLVTLSSVGAGALGVSVLTLLYPRMRIARIVGSDIAHAVPLTLLAGAGYWLLGAVDWRLLGSLLTGSVPGVIIGGLLAARVSASAIRGTLAAILCVVAAKLLF